MLQIFFKHFFSGSSFRLTMYQFFYQSDFFGVFFYFFQKLFIDLALLLKFSNRSYFFLLFTISTVLFLIFLNKQLNTIYEKISVDTGCIWRF